MKRWWLNQVKIHLKAIQRHAREIAAEDAASLASATPSPLIYAANDITETTDEGEKLIAKGTLVQIVSMSGDQITITNGRHIITTTPDSITDVAPEPNIDMPTVDPTPPQSPVAQVEPPAPPTPINPLNVPIQARIDALDEQISQLEEKIDSSRQSSPARATRFQLELNRLQVQKENYVRQLR